MLALRNSLRPFFHGSLRAFSNRPDRDNESQGKSVCPNQPKYSMRNDFSQHTAWAVQKAAKTWRQQTVRGYSNVAGRDQNSASGFSSVNTETIVKIGGAGVALAIIALAGTLIYCQSNPEGEYCDAIRSKLGIGRKIVKIPRAADFVVIRTKLIEEVREQLKLVKTERSVVYITGGPGRGKTELAKMYANASQASYHHTWFVDTEGKSWELEYRNLALAWKLVSAEEKDKLEIQNIISFVHQEFEKQRWSGKRSLIIFDGASKNFVEKCLHGMIPLNTDVLVTSRRGKFDYQVDLEGDDEKLSLKEGMEIIGKRVELKTSEERREAQKIVSKFDNVPLAIAQAANYLSKTGRKIEDYLASFESNKQEILQLSALQDPSRADKMNLFVSIAMNVEEIKNPKALKLLLQSAYLPEKSIPKTLLEKLGHSPIELDTLLRDLETLVIAQSDTISIHSLVQDVAQSLITRENSFQKKLRDLFPNASPVSEQIFSELGSIALEFTNFLMRDPGKAEKIYAQSIQDEQNKPSSDQLKVADLLSSLGDTQSANLHWENALESNKAALELRKSALGKYHLKVANSLNSAGRSLLALGRYSEAMKYEIEALELYESLLGEHHPDVATSLNNVGTTLANLGQYEEALGYLMKALKLQESLFGEGHRDVASSLNNVGSALLGLGRHDEALQYQIKALKLHESLFGEHHPDVATCLNNVGLTLGELGQYEEALQYYTKALKLRTSLLGKGHPDVASSLNNFGSILGDLGQHAEALQYQMKALELSRSLLGEHHPNVATGLNNVGATLVSLGRYAEALQYHMKALRLRESLFKENHPSVATSLDNVGSTLGDLGRHSEALHYHMKALKLRESLFGEHHPEVAISLNNVGSTLGDLGRHEEALQYKMKSLALRKSLFGENHPNVASSLSNIGSTLRDLERYGEALQHQMKSLELLKSLFGENHPEVAMSLNSVGCTLRDLGRYDEALQHQTKSLELIKSLFGGNHPKVAMGLNNVGAILFSLGRREEALRHLMEALKLRKSLLGEYHPDVASTLHNIGWILEDLGRQDEGLRYKLKALEIWEEVVGTQHPSSLFGVNDVKLSLRKLGNDPNLTVERREGIVTCINTLKISEAHRSELLLIIRSSNLEKE